jgi:hypothetical protein
MLNRALMLATVTFLAGELAGAPAHAQNLDAGKSPAQIFAGTCSACHKSPRGLLKTVAPGSLPGFLREHYTTGPDMAGVLSSYLIANGAAVNQGKPDAGPQGGQKRHRKRPKPDDQSAITPDSETAMRQAEQKSEPAATADSAAR